MTWDLNGLRLLALVAQTRSFTEAGETLGLTASAVSKSMTKLERDLGARLLHRTTRSVDLTPDGASFLERCQSVLPEIDDAAAALGRTRTNPQGRLRVQVPVGIGRHLVMPSLLQFADRHPGIVVDVELSDRIADVVHEGLDLVVTIGPPSDAGLVARRLCTLRHLPCASPAYVAQHGEPRTPDDLDQHQCLGYVLSQTRHYRNWVFERDGRTYVKAPSGRLNTNHAESLLNFALAGAGIAMLSSFITADALRNGQLKVLLRDYQGLGPEVFMAFPPNRNLSARVRAFAAFLEELIASRANPAVLPG